MAAIAHRFKRRIDLRERGLGDGGVSRPKPWFFTRSRRRRRYATRREQSVGAAIGIL
jgi:hypothetical protein